MALFLRTRKGAIRDAKANLSRYDPEYAQVLRQLRAAETELAALQNTLPADSPEKPRVSHVLGQVRAAVRQPSNAMKFTYPS